MAEPVVDPLEMIDIAQGHAHARARGGELGIGLLERAAVGQFGQRVAAGIVARLLQLVAQFGRFARRVLKPGGRYVFNVWDKISENDFADEVMKALAVYFPDDPPRFMARTPHGYHEPQPIRDALAAAGFTNVAIDAIDAVSPAASPLDAAIAYCQGTPWRNEIEARDASRLEDATRHAAGALERRFGSGPIKGRIRAFVITASA